jgi:hypothetical protein
MLMTSLARVATVRGRKMSGTVKEYIAAGAMARPTASRWRLKGRG